MSYLRRLERTLALKGNIRVLIIQSTIIAMSYGMLYVIWQPFVLSLGASMAALGALSAVLRLLGSTSSPIWGRLSDRVGRKPLLILSNALQAIAFIFCVIAGVWFLIIPYAVLMGLSASFRQYNPAMASIVAESVEGEQRGTAYSILMFFSKITSAIVAPIGGLLAIAYGYIPIFYACIAASLCSVLLTTMFIQETLETKLQIKLRPNKAWATALQNMLKPESHLKGLYISAIIDAFAWGLGFSILYGMLVKTYHFTTYHLGLMSAISSLAWGISQIPIGKLVDRYGCKPFLVISELLGAVAVIGWLLSGSFETFMFFQIPFGIMVAAWVPTLAALLADSVPKESRAEAMGRLQAFTGVLAVPAPYIGGLLYDTWGFHAPILLNLIGCVTALVLILLLVHEAEEKK